MNNNYTQLFVNIDKANFVSWLRYNGLDKQRHRVRHMSMATLCGTGKQLWYNAEPIDLDPQLRFEVTYREHKELTHISHWKLLEFK